MPFQVLFVNSNDSIVSGGDQKGVANHGFCSDGEVTILSHRMIGDDCMFGDGRPRSRDGYDNLAASCQE